MKNKKKKVLVICLVIALLAIAVVGGSLAWFSDEDQITNAFTVGSIKIEQNEKQHDEETGELEDFEQDQTLLPVANTANPAADNNFIEKIVTVSNTGKNAAYIRTHIAVPTALVDILHLDLFTASKWAEDDVIGTGTVVVDEVEYTVFSYYYTEALEAGADTDVLLEGVWLDSAVDIKENPEEENQLQFCTANEDGTYTFYDYDVTGKVNVLVLTQACQADGFEGYTIQEALDMVFPTLPDFN